MSVNFNPVSMPAISMKSVEPISEYDPSSACESNISFEHEIERRGIYTTNERGQTLYEQIYENASEFDHTSNWCLRTQQNILRHFNARAIETDKDREWGSLDSFNSAILEIEVLKKDIEECPKLGLRMIFNNSVKDEGSRLYQIDFHPVGKLHHLLIEKEIANDTVSYRVYQSSRRKFSLSQWIGKIKTDDENSAAPERPCYDAEKFGMGKKLTKLELKHFLNDLFEANVGYNRTRTCRYFYIKQCEFGKVEA